MTPRQNSQSWLWANQNAQEVEGSVSCQEGFDSDTPSTYIELRMLVDFDKGAVSTAKPAFRSSEC